MKKNIERFGIAYVIRASIVITALTAFGWFVCTHNYVVMNSVTGTPLNFIFFVAGLLLAVFGILRMMRLVGMPIN